MRNLTEEEEELGQFSLTELIPSLARALDSIGRR